ncbi:EAP30/Vps36 family-domain-containing protein [Radiomyces spectabilis]|uniref:EAP30/Vps36 family-domain-containing protein n=1 Tax=Radiomyces spectabilis TaxID=64574 RepID=UPI00221FD2D2|nr:EAP30/Vps36 family-domain-containing protein [Radiomyces spectabilis]KAI8377505.1 EAP30/Vps36 family-domain-containing protein [Radiomyces spectabilis]
MKYFIPTQLSSSRRPELLPGESLLVQQGNTGIYEGKHKVDSCQDGISYLTTHRIIYVDKQKPWENSVELSLANVKDLESYGGFLRSSPKVILQLDMSVQSPKKSHLTARTSSSPALVSTGIWVCSVCSFSNKASTDKCELCGVRKSPSQTATLEVQSSAADTDENQLVCRLCTFLNHPSMTQCEMCGAELPTVSLSPSVSSTPSTPTSHSKSTDTSETPQVRIAFRQGGHSGFYSKLKTALHGRAWEKITEESPKPTSPVSGRGVGISAIQGRIQQSTQEANATMTDAFQDLDRLIAKATDMVKLAESISTKMSKDNENSDSDMSTLRGYLLNLGIASPVTKGSAGSIYHQELARELAEFLGKFLNENNGMKPLTDIYCIFNRARGVALISPEDLYKASMQFEALHLPFRLRRFASGLLVIQSLHMDDDRAAQRVLNYVKQQSGHITALRLAELENIALVVATEQLLISETKGLLCRDEGPTGLTFYENKFLSV